MALSSSRSVFGLPQSFQAHMAALAGAQEEDVDKINARWKSRTTQDSYNKAAWFTTLAMLKYPTLKTWLDQTPRKWWTDKTSQEYKSYNAMAGGMLHSMFVSCPDVFKTLLTDAPYIFQAESCANFVEKWLPTLTAQELELFQPMLRNQPIAWYSTKGSRIKWLTNIEANFNEVKGALFSAAFASENKEPTIHPEWAAMYPGLDVYVSVLDSMYNDTKKQKVALHQWLLNQGMIQDPAITDGSIFGASY